MDEHERKLLRRLYFYNQEFETTRAKMPDFRINQYMALLRGVERELETYRRYKGDTTPVYPLPPTKTFLSPR